MRVYKLNNTWYTYDDLHNTLGYTRYPTNQVSFNSTGNSGLDWGDSDGSGYAEQSNLYSEQLLFRSNSTGWYSLNDLVSTLHVYPSTSNDIELLKGNVISPTVYLSFSDSIRYLIKEDLSVGWITEEEYTARGWSIPTYDFVLVDNDTGKVKSGSTYNGLVFSDHTGYYILEPQEELVITGHIGYVVIEPPNEFILVGPNDIITLYMVPTAQRSQQSSVINTTGNITHTYQLYTSETVQDETTKFTPDLTKKYILGKLENGEFVPYNDSYVDLVTDMPTTTTTNISQFVHLIELLENGRVWMGANYSKSVWYSSKDSQVYKIVDKPGIAHTVSVAFDGRNRLVWTITLNDTSFRGELVCFLLGFTYLNSNKTSTQKSHYFGVVSFENGVGTYSEFYGQSYYGFVLSYTEIDPHWKVGYVDPNYTAISIQDGAEYTIVPYFDYDSSKTYTVIKYFTSSTSMVGLNATGLSVHVRSGWTYASLLNNSGSTISIQRFIYSVE